MIGGQSLHNRCPASRTGYPFPRKCLGPASSVVQTKQLMQWMVRLKQVSCQVLVAKTSFAVAAVVMHGLESAVSAVFAVSAVVAWNRTSQVVAD
jgi:hypothetical protein